MYGPHLVETSFSSRHSAALNSRWKRRCLLGSTRRGFPRKPVTVDKLQRIEEKKSFGTMRR